MEIGELVDSVFAFPNSSNLIAIGCEGGKMQVYDVQAEKSVFELNKEDAVIVIRGSGDENIFYTATEAEITMRDIREKDSSKIIFKSPSDISDFAVKDTTIAVATMESDIQMVDKRVLKKPKYSSILPPVCNSLCFRNKDKIVAGYIDTAIGEWTLSSKKFVAYQTMQQLQQMNPGVVHCVACQEQIVASATQNSLSFFKNGKVIKSGVFEHDGAVQYVTFAPCFEGNVSVSAASDGSLMILDVDNMKVIDCIQNEEEKVQCISANKNFVVVADTSDNGTIGIFKPDDFGSEE
jgi:WD40 repeat protein